VNGVDNTLRWLWLLGLMAGAAVQAQTAPLAPYPVTVPISPQRLGIGTHSDQQINGKKVSSTKAYVKQVSGTKVNSKAARKVMIPTASSWPTMVAAPSAKKPSAVPTSIGKMTNRTTPPVPATAIIPVTTGSPGNTTQPATAGAATPPSIPKQVAVPQPGNVGKTVHVAPAKHTAAGPAAAGGPSVKPIDRIQLPAVINRDPTGVLPGISFQENAWSTQGSVPEQGFVASQVTLVSTSLPQAMAQARIFAALGLRILRRQNLTNLGFVYSVFGTPAGLTSMQAKDQILAQAPKLQVDVNHRYRLQGTSSGPRQYAEKLLGWKQAQPVCGKPVRIGLIDTAVDTQHPALQQADIIRLSVIPAGYPLASQDHGTGIAALLLGRSPNGVFHGVLPQAELIAVSSFIQRPQQQIETTAEWLAQALDLLVGKQVRVINMSLGGGRDRLLDRAIQAVGQRAIVVVAAAGNGGSNAAPVYPAADPGVIAVTAVDARSHIFREANQGAYVEFAAPGVDVWSARAVKGGKYYSGTSFSTPFVTAAVARLLPEHELNIGQVRSRLRAKVRDLGAPGRDPVYGYGLIQFPGGCG